MKCKFIFLQQGHELEKNMYLLNAYDIEMETDYIQFLKVQKLEDLNW